MSGSSRHGSGRPPGSTASWPATGRPATGRPATGRAATDRPAAGRPAAGQAAPEGRLGAGGRAFPPIDANRVAALAEPVIHAMDLDLEGIRITAAGRRRVLRLVVDGDGGVSLDDIALASRELSAVLDDSEVMGEVPYILEVSSPGVDRPLTERRHWRRAIGRLVVVPLAAAGASGTGASAPGASAGGSAAGASGPGSGNTAETGSAGVVEGRITGASAEGITLEVDGESRQFGYGDLGPGRIKIEFARLADIAEEDDVDDQSADEEGLNGY